MYKLAEFRQDLVKSESDRKIIEAAQKGSAKRFAMFELRNALQQSDRFSVYWYAQIKLACRALSDGDVVRAKALHDNNSIMPGFIL